MGQGHRDTERWPCFRRRHGVHIFCLGSSVHVPKSLGHSHSYPAFTLNSGEEKGWTNIIISSTTSSCGRPTGLIKLISSRESLFHSPISARILEAKHGPTSCLCFTLKGMWPFLMGHDTIQQTTRVDSETCYVSALKVPTETVFKESVPGSEVYLWFCDVNSP